MLAKQLLHNRDWDSSSLIDKHKFGLGELGVILRLDVLNGLAMVAENIYAHNCMVELRIR